VVEENEMAVLDADPALPDARREDGVLWDSEVAKLAWAVRGHPLAAGPSADPFDRALKHIRREHPYGLEHLDAEVERFLALAEDVNASRAIVQRLMKISSRFSDLVAAIQGVPTALEALATWARGQRYVTARELSRFRSRIAATTNDEEYARYSRMACEFADADPDNGSIFAFLFPTELWAKEIATREPDNLNLLSLHDRPTTMRVNYNFYAGSDSCGGPAGSLLHRFAVDAIDAIIEQKGYEVQESTERALLLSRIGDDRAFAALLAEIAARHAQVSLQQACSLQPNRAVRLLSAVRGKHEELARVRLLELHGKYPGLLASHLVAGPATTDQARVLRSIVEQVALPPAETSTLPELLQSPPWLQKRVEVPRRRIENVPPIHVDPVLQWAPGEQETSRKLPTYFEERFRGSDEDRAALVRHHIAKGEIQPSLLFSIPVAFVDEVLMLEPNLYRYSSYFLTDTAAKLLAFHELKAEPFVVKMARQTDAHVLRGCLALGSTGLASAAALAYQTKRDRRIALRWLLRFPVHATCGLIPDAVGPYGKPRTAAEHALRLLASNGHRDLIEQTAKGVGESIAEAVSAVLDQDPLLLLPKKMPAICDWISPEIVAPLNLIDGAARLPDSAVEHLISMLMISTLESPYAGLDVVREMVEPASLGRFSWSVFLAWMAGGYQKDGGWAITQLGLFGDDEVARKLSALVRVWPGEGGHARAAVGLDVLATIGSDVSLMHLNRIAETAKFKGLKDNAKERITLIAESRGLSQEELADRLVPDLGLEDDGTLWLDFGPRRFQVGFDELLAPVVRDENGAVLRALAKPNAKDDPAKAKAAGERWKVLKKDATEASKTQIRRIELAMVRRRRWDSETFDTIFVQHPLMWHVARRLVWAVFTKSGTLVETFRIAEDRTLADANDDAYTISPIDEQSDRCIGIPHPLQLGAELVAAWGQTLADYELLQPFAQVGREIYTITDAEKTEPALKRQTNIRCHFGKILSLEYKGWVKGEAQDGGSINYLTKSLCDGRLARLQLTEGLWAGSMTDTPDQDLGDVRIVTSVEDYKSKTPLSSMDPIDFSETVRDLEQLR
jgi:hypothetical protein